MAPQVPESYLEARRNQIIDAACQCFAEKGFHKASMQDVFSAANLSAGAVYNYFESKEDIVAACAEKGQQNTAEMIRTAASLETGDPLGNVMNLFFSLTKEPGYVKSASFELELLSECGRNPGFAEMAQSNMGTVLTEVCELVKRRQKAGIFNLHLDSIAISRVLVAMYYGLMIQMLVDSNTDIDSYISVCGAIMDGTFSREAA